MARRKKDPREKDLENRIAGIAMRVGKQNLAYRTGIPVSTMYRKLKSVRTLTAAEIWAIEDADYEGRTV